MGDRHFPFLLPIDLFYNSLFNSGCKITKKVAKTYRPVFKYSKISPISSLFEGNRAKMGCIHLRNYRFTFSSL